MQLLCTGDAFPSRSMNVPAAIVDGAVNGALVSALQMFDDVLTGYRSGRQPPVVEVSACDGSTFPLGVPGWCAPANGVDRLALRRFAAPLAPGATVIDLAAARAGMPPNWRPTGCGCSGSISHRPPCC